MPTAKKGYSRGYVVSAKKSKAFLKNVSASRPTKEFWDDCANIRKHINKDSIAKMNELMDSED